MSVTLRGRIYLVRSVGNTGIYAPDGSSLATVVRSLRIIKERSPVDYRRVNRAGMIIVITPIVLRDYNLVKCGYRLRPVYYVDKGMLKENNGIYLASLLVHETQHVYQSLSFRKKYWGRSKREADACRAQVSFLRRIDAPHRHIELVQEELCSQYWIADLKSGEKSHHYFDRLDEFLFQNHFI